MRIIMLHGVGDARYPTAVFERQLTWLGRHFEVLPLGDLVARVESQAPSSGREVALTFDDGLQNNVSIVAPLLERHGMPATFFVCPGLVETGEWLWNHEARARLEGLAPAAVADLCEAAGLPGQGASPIEDLIRQLKTLALPARSRFERRIRNATPDFVPTDDQHLESDIATWDELCSLDPDLITIGSHTITHPILTTLDDDQIAFEVYESRELLEQRLGRPVEYFCYPNGSQDPRVRAQVAQCYRAAVTTQPGLLVEQPDPYLLPRIGAVACPSHLAWRLHRP